jgi:methyl-accepting chemotaxis protein
MGLMEDFSNKVSIYVFPALLAITIYFVKRFIDKVDRELERLNKTVNNSASNLNEKTSEIRISLATLELSVKNTAEKVQDFAKKISDCVTRLDKHQELHTKSAQIFKGHGSAIKKNKDMIETVVRHVGENTIVSERKKQNT